MLERLASMVLDESKWLTFAMLLAFVAAGAWARRWRRSRALDASAILAAMNLFYGVMIGVMGSGHVLAVAVAQARGTLQGSVLLLVPLGLCLAIPAWWLVASVAGIAQGRGPSLRRAALLDAWLGIALLALGLHNFPLALPAALNLAYQFHSRRAVGRVILVTAIAANLFLFVGSLVFLASGRSFEEFSGT